jgi:hypothetical protein
VIQAERHIADADAEPILGLRTFEGEGIVASGDEVQLLGQNLPI